MEKEISIPLEELSLEDFKKIIESNLLEDEIPFDLIYQHYPSLLNEWYPGYPGMLRKMTKKDPILLKGYIKNSTITFDDIQTDENKPLSMDIQECSLEGYYDVWVRQEGKDFKIYMSVEEEKI